MASSPRRINLYGRALLGVQGLLLALMTVVGCYFGGLLVLLSGLDGGGAAGFALAAAWALPAPALLVFLIVGASRARRGEPRTLVVTEILAVAGSTIMVVQVQVIRPIALALGTVFVGCAVLVVLGLRTARPATDTVRTSS